MRLLFVLLLLLVAETGQAQSWQANFDTRGFPPEALWRYDRDAFVQGRGSLHLAVPDSIKRGEVTLMTSLTLPRAPRWQGTLHFGLLPSRLNHPLLLLCATQALSNGSYEYLALDFGGRASRQVTLLRITATLVDGRPVITPRQDVLPILTSPQIIQQGQDLAFDLSYVPEEGFTLYLQDLSAHEGKHLAGQASLHTFELSPQNSFGISCAFTPKGRHAWSFRQLRIAPVSDPLPAPSPDDPPASPAEPADLRLSEVMPHPASDAPEYIEIYNASPEAQPLVGYLLWTGTDQDHLHAVSLPDTLLPASSYAVLTRSEQAMRSAYPQLPASALVLSVALPRLPNKAGTIALSYGDEQLLDTFAYSSALLPRGKKTKAGIAFERTNLLSTNEAPHWAPALDAEGYATPGSPATQASSASEASSQSDTFAKLLDQLAQSPGLTCSWQVYSFVGEKLAEGEGEAGKHLLLALRSEPASFFALLPTGTRGQVVLLRLTILREQGKVERFTLPLRYRP